jgi:hypothetical protein
MSSDWFSRRLAQVGKYLRSRTGDKILKFFHILGLSAPSREKKKDVLTEGLPFITSKIET